VDPLTLMEWTSGRFILVLLRLTTLLALAPFYGLPNVPVRLRIGLALLIALIVTPLVAVPDLATYSLAGFLLLAMKEAVIGALLAFSLLLVFAAAQFSGHIAGYQMGLAMANTVDPQGQISISVVGEIYYVIAMLLFLAFDGHHFIMRAVVYSFDLIPVDALVLDGGGMRLLIRLSADIFLLAIQLAAPVIAALLTTSVALGLIARTVPQMNVFIVGFPVKVGLGLLVTVLSLPYFATAFRLAWQGAERDALRLLTAFAGR
jgi:flagellar biosynthetic protein FliR